VPSGRDSSTKGGAAGYLCGVVTKKSKVVARGKRPAVKIDESYRAVAPRKLAANSRAGSAVRS